MSLTSWYIIDKYFDAKLIFSSVVEDIVNDTCIYTTYTKQKQADSEAAMNDVGHDSLSSRRSSQHKSFHKAISTHVCDQNFT